MVYESIKLLGALLKPEAVGLVECGSIGTTRVPTRNSAFGNSDGHVYKHLEEKLSPSRIKKA